MKRCAFVVVLLVAMVVPMFAQDKAPPPPQEVKLLHVRFTVTNEKGGKAQVWVTRGEHPSIQLSPKNTLTVLEINHQPEGSTLIVQWDTPDGSWTRFKIPNGSAVQLCGSECYRVKVEEVKD